MMNKGRTWWSDESGVALITVLGVMVVVTALAFGSYAIAQQALLETNRVEGETQAYRAAASGLDRELATFQEDGLSEVYPKYGSTGDGTYTVTVEDVGPSRYRLVSTGIGKDGSSERVAQEFYFLNLWKMNFAGTGGQSLVSGSDKITGGSNIVGPFYMKGTLTLDASMSVQEGPLFVYDGDIERTAKGVRFGDPDLRVDVFCDGDYSSLPDGEKKVFLGNVDAAVPEINTPELTQEMMEGYASTARAESVDNNMGPVSRGIIPIHECDAVAPSGSDYTDPVYTGAYSTSPRQQASSLNPNYKFLGADETIGPLGEGAYDYTLGATTPDFGWWGSTYEGSSLPTGYASAPAAYPTGDFEYPQNVHDDFAWDQSTSTLYIEGTVFIDGDLTIDTDVTYIGNGTLVVNGDVTINGLLRPAGTSAQARNNEWALGIATPNGITFTANTGQMSAGNPDAEEIRARTPDVAGAFYASKYIVIPEKLLIQGSVITGEIRAGTNNVWLVTNPMLPDYLPDSLPGSAGGLMTPTRWMRY